MRVRAQARNYELVFTMNPTSISARQREYFRGDDVTEQMRRRSNFSPRTV